MIISIRRYRKFLLFATLFFLIIILISQIFLLFSPLIPFRPPYQEPYGNAVKVFVQQVDNRDNEVISTIADRLRLFYWIGE